MSAQENGVPIRGSDRSPLPGSRLVGPADPTETATVTVVLRPRPDAATGYTEGGLLPGRRQATGRSRHGGSRAADPVRVAAVEAFARAHDLTVVDSSAVRRAVVLSGSVAALSAAFGVELMTYEHEDGRYRGRTGRVQIPAELSDHVVGVMGLDNRPQARPHMRRAAHAAASPRGTFTPPEIAALYGFPKDATGAGQTVAIIELGGGFDQGDLTTYFTGLGITPPRVTAVSVDGGANAPSNDPNSADGEVMLDIEVVGAVAPGAAIVVYFAPNTDQGFLDAITTAIHDTEHSPSVISISWGSAESSWTQQALQSFDEAFLDAAHLGVTVCVAAGDSGSFDSVKDGRAHADFPASDPYVLGCGGTHLVAHGGRITSERVWNGGDAATGGGVSDVWDLPDYQAGAGVPRSLNPDGRVGRGVPDISGDADPATGYVVRVHGEDAPIGGTSAVAPLWAGLIALVNEKMGTTAGFLNPLLYEQASSSGALRDITEGDNDLTKLGGYAARAGWDACTGLGTPDGERLLAVLSGMAAAVRS